MPAERDARREALLGEIRQELRAVSCSLRLLSRHRADTRARAILTAAQQTLARAEKALNRLPGLLRP